MARIAVTFAPTALPPDARDRLLQGLAGHDVSFADDGDWSNLQPTSSPHTHAADVIYGQPAVDDLQRTDARFVQLTSAGYGRYDADALRQRGIALCTSSSVYAQPVAESALAMLLGALRRLPHTLADQPHARWNAAAHRRASSLLHGARVAVLGWGAIAQALAPALVAVGARPVVVRRTVRGDEPLPTVPRDRWHEALHGAEALVNTLPGTDDTEGLVDADALAQLAPGAVVVNVGRGTTIDTEALLDALRRDHLGGAWLDVTDPEPLPPGHALWTTDRVWISPHVAGGWRGEHLALVEHFLANVGRWQADEPLLDRRA
jgi:phosphoglycerate dehydrogenase-like enzyme